MREKFVLTGQEQFDVDKFDDYAKYLTSLIKVDKNLLSKMGDGEKTVLFSHFFKFIQEAYYEMFGVMISEDDENILDYATELMIRDKKFAKKLADYVNQYLTYVHFQLLRKEQLKAKQVQKLENIRQEAEALTKYISSVLGHTDENGDIVDYRENDAMNIRMKTIWKLRGFMQDSNMFSGGDAEQVTHVPKMDPATYKGIIKCFNPDVFYSLEKEDILNLVEGLVDGYCSMNNVERPNVEFRKFAQQGNKKTFGCYADGVDTLYLNEEFLAEFERAKETKDPYLPIRLMQTGLHETRHKIQVANMNRQPENERDRQLAFKMNASLQMAQQGNPNFASYLSRIEEADARYVAIKEMENFARQGLLDESSKQMLAQLRQEELYLRQLSAQKELYKNKHFQLEDEDEPQMSLFTYDNAV
ncbi:MAG: hypothetical protein J6J23_00155 [Clostridia bacterium]|nr:hypothetical protein [Clostridia bacterium]